MARFFVPGASTPENILAYVAKNPGCTRAAIRRDVAIHHSRGADGLTRAMDRLIASDALVVQKREQYTYRTDGSVTVREVSGYEDILFVAQSAAVAS